MKDLINDFRSSNTTKRIGIFADLASLLGVSIAAVATTLFSLSGRVNVVNVVFAGAHTLLFIGGLALLAALYWLVRRILYIRLQSEHFPHVMFQIMAGCVFASLVLVGGYLFYEYLDSFHYINRGV